MTSRQRLCSCCRSVCSFVLLLLFSSSRILFGGGVLADDAHPASIGGYRPRYEAGRCERITIPLCSDMKYNMTRMPNLVGLSTQSEAAMQVYEFMPLIQFGCSRFLKFFLCSLYAPMCTVQVDETMVIPACKSMCMEVREKCEPVLQRFNFHWPAVLDCSELPERSDRSKLCIDLPPASASGGGDFFYEDGDENRHLAESSSRPGGVGLNPEWTKLQNAFQASSALLPTTQNAGAVTGPWSPSMQQPPGGRLRSTPASLCPDRFVPISGRNHNKNETDDVTKTCAARCGVDVMYSWRDKRFIETWMTVWSTLCLASCLFAIATILLDRSRFDYPERPVVFIAVSLAFYSSAYIVRAAAGAQTVSCDQPRGIDPQLLPGSVGIDLYVIREGLESVWCISVFLVLYYFGTAASVWWTMMSIAWFLASARKWSREAIQSYAGYMHLFGWSLPAVQTIVVLAIRRVDGDELTGLCYVGNQDSIALIGFVLVPLAVYLIVGTVFTGLGFLALFGVRHDLKRGSQTSSTTTSGGRRHATNDVRKLDKLMARIGAFSGLYVVAMSCHLATLLYQQRRTVYSLEVAYNSRCRFSQAFTVTDFNVIQQSCIMNESLQSVYVHAAKICSLLLIGVTTGLWMLSAKTIRAWSSFLTGRCCCGKRNRTAAADISGTRGRRLQCDVQAEGRQLYSVGAAGVAGRSVSVAQNYNNRSGGSVTVAGSSNGGGCSKTSSYAALNKSGALSLATVI